MIFTYDLVLVVRVIFSPQIFVNLALIIQVLVNNFVLTYVIHALYFFLSITDRNVPGTRANTC